MVSDFGSDLASGFASGLLSELADSLFTGSDLASPPDSDFDVSEEEPFELPPDLGA